MTKLLQTRQLENRETRFVQTLMNTNFPNDCGFQTINMIMRIVTSEVNEDQPACSPFIPEDANCWRHLFAHQLKITGQSVTLVRPPQMRFGGAKTDEVEDHVRELLVQHGVAEDEAAKRCSLVFDKVGRPSLLKVSRSSRPWAELKALANAQTPKLQLALPSELEITQKRGEAGKAIWGEEKRYDQKKGETKISLTPGDVTIPFEMFKQGQSEFIGQIPLTAIRAEAAGVVVVDSQQAQPYLKLANPVSKYDLGLLILDHDAASVQSVGSVIRFPARCEITSGPIIVTARPVQVGNAEVSSTCSCPTVQNRRG